MSIAQRLLILLGTSVLTLLLIAGINYTQTGRVYEAANFSTVNTVPSLLVLDDALYHFSHVRVRLYRQAIHTDPQERANLEKGINEEAEAFQKSLKDYEPLLANDEDRAFLNKEKDTFTRYLEIARKAMELSNHGQKEEALRYLDQNASNGTELLDTLEKHKRMNERMGKEGAATAVAVHRTATIINIVMVSAALLVIGGIVVFTRKSILSQLGEANQLANRVAAGDLREQRLEISGDEIGSLMKALEKMRADLAQTVGQIANSTETLANSADHLATAANQVSTSSQNQSSATSAAAAAVEELTVSIDHVGSSADDANARAEEAGEAAISSGQNVSRASNQIGRVAESVEDTSGRIRSLADQVQLIGNITTVIREVADQTNLLALNAAIEAARAGEQGRGFAVVADEVRKLAERTTLSVQEISTLISSIQAGVSSAEQSMEASRQIVTEVVTVAETASSSMGSIESATGTAREAIAGISYALREQRSTSTELAQNVESIAQMSEENSSAASSVAETAQQLVRVSGALKSAVSRFRV